MKTESIREIIKTAMPEFKIAGKLKRIKKSINCMNSGWGWKCLMEFADEENTNYAVLLLTDGSKVLAVSDFESYREIVI